MDYRWAVFCLDIWQKITPNMKNSVSIIIPNYNGKQLLEKNLPQVIKACIDHEIIVVDDASTDESVIFLKKNYPQIKLLEKERNDGFATTVNLGVKAAQGEIVVLINTDVLPQGDFLKLLLQHFKNDKVFAVGCLEKSWEKGQFIERGRGIGRFKHGFLEHARGETNINNTLWVSGGSGAYRKSIWEKLGGMDELYNPFYWEDLDLGYRALKSGYKLVFEVRSQVTHLHEQGSIKSKYTAAEIEKIAYRNQFIFVWKNITDTRYLLNHLFWLPIYLFIALIKGNMHLVGGFVAAVGKLPEIIRHRSKQVTIYTQSDAEVLSQFQT